MLALDEVDVQAKERACGELNDKCSGDILADDEEFYRHAEKERGGMVTRSFDVSL